MPEIDQSSAERAVESDYETYLKQRALSIVLVKASVVSAVWLAIGAATLGAAAMVRPDADVVGMDPVGREHPIVVMPIQAVGAKK